MEKDFSRRCQLWKLFRRIRNQIAAHAQKSAKFPLTSLLRTLWWSGDDSLYYNFLLALNIFSRRSTSVSGQVKMYLHSVSMPNTPNERFKV